MPARLMVLISSALAAACGVLAAPASAQQLGPGEIVVSDATADPDGAAGAGAIFRVDPTTGAVSVLGESPDFAAPSGVAIDASGNVLVADPLAQPAGEPGTGAIFRIVPGQAPTVFATSADFEAPTGVAVDGAGNVLVADQSADPAPPVGGNTGTVFRFAPGNPPQVLDKGPQYVDPWSLAVDANGDVLVADRDAGFGSIIKFTPGGAPGTAFAAGFDDPSGVTVSATGQILVVDPDASPVGNPPFSGEISSITTGGVVTDLPSAGFEDPFGVDTDAQGRALVADSVDVNGGATGAGAVFRFTPGQPPAVFASSSLFRRPNAVAAAPGSPTTAVPDPIASVPPPKKCKKGQKLKKGKCVKKKRKKRKRK
jgi:hypothetical protein